MDSLKAMLFGRHLVTCFLDYDGFIYKGNLLVGHQQAELFDEKTEPDVSWSISDIVSDKYELILEMFREFQLHENWKDPSYFGSCLLQAAPTFFQQGYSPEHFLAFCAVVIGVLQILYEEEGDHPDFADKAADVIGIVLTGHMISGEFFQEGSWQRLCAVASALIYIRKTERVE